MSRGCYGDGVSSVPDRFRAAYGGRTACVTGGAGFIGSHLCDALVAAGATVRVIDDLSNGQRENLAPLGDAVTLIEASILDADAMASAAEGCHVIFHQAAAASVPASIRDPEKYYRVNVTGTLGVLEAARAAGITRVVSASSSSVYGDQPESPKIESMRLDPLSPYAASKAAGEHLVRSHALCYDLTCVSLRYFNIFGPRQRPDSPYAAVLPKFATSLARSETPVIYGDGQQTRDFTHVSNAVHANLLAGCVDAPLRGEAMNVAAGRSRTVIELLNAVAACLNVEPKHETADARLGDVLHSLASIEVAENLLGYEVVVPFDEGLRPTVEYYAHLDSAAKQ